MIMGKIVGLDVGDVRIGIAVCDEMRLIASPHSVYRPHGIRPAVKPIKRLSGHQGHRDFRSAQRLANAGLNIAFQDERLTTVTAERALIEGGMHRQERKGTVDKVAAAVILQQYLDTLRNQT